MERNMQTGVRDFLCGRAPVERRQRRWPRTLEEAYKNDNLMDRNLVIERHSVIHT
jgi:hypothetical protein